MPVFTEINTPFELCLGEAKTRLVMVAFLNFNHEHFSEMTQVLERISSANKRLVILTVDANKNIELVRGFDINVCPTFLFFRNRCLLGSKVTTKEDKLIETVDKFNKTFVSIPQSCLVEE